MARRDVGWAASLARVGQRDNVRLSSMLIPVSVTQGDMNIMTRTVLTSRPPFQSVHVMGEVSASENVAIAALKPVGVSGTQVSTPS